MMSNNLRRVAEDYISLCKNNTIYDSTNDNYIVQGGFGHY